MANANVSKIGLDAAVAAEEAAAKAAPEATPAVAADVAPNVSERRVIGRKEIKTPSGQVIVIENL